MNGLDISSYQAGIDFAELKDKNGKRPDFVIIKATQGKSYVNPALFTQLEGAKAAGLLIGLYHYYSNNGSPEEQAEHFFDVIKGINADFNIWLDWESEQNGLNFGQPARALLFIKAINKMTGKKCGIYTSKGFLGNFVGYDVLHVPLWAAQYASMKEQEAFREEPWTDKNGWGPWSGPDVFQWTSRGKLNGWGAYLDLDKSYMNAEEWRASAKREAEAPKTAAENATAAAAVLCGQFGNGEARVNSLKALGFDPVKIQEIVNFIVAKS